LLQRRPETDMYSRMKGRQNPAWSRARRRAV
jgi:hypothetical protein